MYREQSTPQGAVDDAERRASRYCQGFENFHSLADSRLGKISEPHVGYFEYDDVLNMLRMRTKALLVQLMDDGGKKEGGG